MSMIGTCERTASRSQNALLSLSLSLFLSLSFSFKDMYSFYNNKLQSSNTVRDMKPCYTYNSWSDMNNGRGEIRKNDSSNYNDTTRNRLRSWAFFGVS